MGSAQQSDEATARYQAVAPELVEPLRRYLARRTDRRTAESVLEVTFAECWRLRAELPDEDARLPWAYAVARRRLADVEAAPATPPRPATGSGDGRRYRDFLDDSLRDAWARLRPTSSEVLRLWAWEQLTAPEIAAVLEISPNAASSRLRRAKAALRAELDRDLEAAEGTGDTGPGEDAPSGEDDGA